MNSPFLVCSHHVQQKLHHAADMHNRKGLRYTVLYIQAQKAPTGALNIMNRQNSFSSENDNFTSEKSIGIQMSTSPKTIVTVHEFHLHYSDFYDCGFKSLVMVAFVNEFFNPESRKIFVKEGYFVIFKEKKIAHCIGVW